jgi:hypothetical protein
MSLNEAEKKEVVGWLERGLKLADIQKRIESEFGLRLTYLEVKLLVSELNVLPKDPATQPAKGPTPSAPGPAEPTPAPAPSGGVSVTVDQLARPGAVASGSVTFSDGQQAVWYLDEAMRLGLISENKGYRPPAADVPEFQRLLQNELARAGF